MSRSKSQSHISETQPEHVRSELTRNLRGQGDHSLLAMFRKGSLVDKQYKALGKLILADDSVNVKVKPGALPGDPKALRGIPAIGGRGSIGGAIAGTRPGDSLVGRRGEEILRGIRQRARDRDTAVAEKDGDVAALGKPLEDADDA